MKKTRTEHDALGPVEVPQDALWGAQTQRSYENFKIGEEKMPLEVLQAIGLVKKASARANYDFGKLPQEKYQAIAQSVDEIFQGDFRKHFPLALWQTGSGTQSNMNVNEVISHWSEKYHQVALHPNDEVNLSQSSNDVFPTAMHLAARMSLEELFVSCDQMIESFKRLEAKYGDLYKIGRTHLQDAVPIRFGQEVSAWRTMIEKSKAYLEESSQALLPLATGGTAVGTGLNAPQGFGDQVASYLAQETGLPFTSEPNKFHALSSQDAIAYVHGALAALASNLMKIANDIRWLASGPRAGFGELDLPANEPGSSIMPGKVNPTQAEALTMVTVQVLGNQTTIAVAASQGNLQLNVYLPVIIHNFLQSVRLLADGMDSFRTKALDGLQANGDKMRYYLEESLMLVTALTPQIGYDRAAQAALTAFEKGIRLKEAVLELGYLTADEFDQATDPQHLV